MQAYIFVRLLLVVVTVLTKIILIFIILIFEVTLLEVIVHLLKLKSLAGEPVNSTWDELLLDILTKLVIQLKALLNIRSDVIVVLLSWSLWWREEVEERLSWNGLLDNAGLLGVYKCVSNLVEP